MLVKEGTLRVRDTLVTGDPGCRVLAGVLRRSARVRLERDGDVVWQGGVASLRRFREDVREVSEGLDCGLVLAGFSDVQVGDVLVALETTRAPGGATRAEWARAAPATRADTARAPSTSPPSNDPPRRSGTSIAAPVGPTRRV